MEDRVYEATTTDGGPWAVDARQVSGPPLRLQVVENRFSFWGRGPAPAHPSRSHLFIREIDGDIKAMDEIRGGKAGVKIFKKCRKPGDIGFFVHRIGIVQPGES